MYEPDYNNCPTGPEPTCKRVDVQSDLWKHRSSGMLCRTCMWYVTKSNTELQLALGRCRRHAPTLSGYPAVFPTDWCGDHKLDENKL